MPFNQRDFKQINKDDQDKKSSGIHKTILRNPEVPLIEKYAEKYPRAENNRNSYNHEAAEKVIGSSSREFHNPSMNNLKEVKDKLRRSEAPTSQNMQEFSSNDQTAANREVKKLFDDKNKI